MALIGGSLVTLRAFEPSDADAVWRWQHDPEIVRWMDAGYSESLSALRTRFESARQNSYERLVLGIETIETRDLVGMVALRDAEPETGHAELDVYVGDRNHWGRGVATDAVRTMCRYGFDAMRLHRISLTVVADNESARHVYRKVGFVEEGRLREVFRSDGQWHDKIVMAVLDHELT